MPLKAKYGSPLGPVSCVPSRTPVGVTTYTGVGVVAEVVVVVWVGGRRDMKERVRRVRKETAIAIDEGWFFFLLLSFVILVFL